MRRPLLAAICALLLAVSMSTFHMHTVRAVAQVVYINADGSITPSGVPITTFDNATYFFTGNISYPTYSGIVIQRNNTVIDGNDFTVEGNGGGYGLYSRGVNNVTIENTSIQEFAEGILFDDSLNNNIRGNTFTNDGLHFSDSYNNSVENNIVNGKPLVYLEDVTNFSVVDAGQLILIDCNNITIENLNLSNAGEGVELWDTNNTIISGNNVTANKYGGIELISCNYNNLTENSVTNSEFGIYLDDSFNNSISGNSIENDRLYGAKLDESCSDNSLNDNNIANNGIGIWLEDASGNAIYHNAFENNQIQAVNLGRGDRLLKNTWDDGYPSGGNYWSDYNGSDSGMGLYQNMTGSDGIGDTPYVIDVNNTDKYPLMGVYHEFFPTFFSDNNVSVVVIGNSTVSNLIYAIWLSTPYDGLQAGVPFIEFLTSGRNESISFCRVMIPRTILNATIYDVSVDYNPINVAELPISNTTYVYLYFTYPMPAQQVIITIPEYASFLLLLLFVAPTLLGAFILRRKRNEKIASATPRF